MSNDELAGRQIQVRLVKRFDRADVFPITVEKMNLNVARADRGGKHFFAEIAIIGFFQHVDQRFAG